MSLAEVAERHERDLSSQRVDRNLNTGGNNYDEKAGLVAHNSVHHGGAHASRVVLSVRKAQ